MKDQPYIQAKYSVAIEVAKSPENIFHHLMHNVSKFWPEEFQGRSAHLNDEFVFSMGDSHYSRNKVVELVPDKKVVWLVTESIRKTDNFEWTGTQMIFELTPRGDRTLLQFTYDGPALEHEYNRLVQVCDLVIKENLYNFLTTSEADASFTTTIEVARSPREVFNCLKEVPKWWSRDFEGSSLQLNDEFVIHHPGSHYSKQKLVDVIPDQKIVWLVTDSTLHWLRDQHEWTNTRMIFELTGQGDDRTLLRYTHEGLVPEKECYARCAEGWTMVIRERLFNFITEGKTV